jgi:hypothetical protein
MLIGLGLVVGLVGCVGCAWNRPLYTERTTGTNGTVTVKKLSVATLAIWPATTSLEKQRVSIGKTMTVGTSGLSEDGGGTNMVDALKAIDSILGKLR